jgi:hypothetical protein
MKLQGEARAKLLADLHALATFLEDHPEIPISPYDVCIGHSVSVAIDDDRAGIAEVERIADFLGTEVSVSGGTHHRALLKIGGASYEATYIDRQHMADYDEYMASWHKRGVERVTS